MSDKFNCCSIETLVQWILAEEKTGQIFGIPRGLFFEPRNDDVFKMQRYGQALETPLGVAAGPHTQLAQNIVSAWLTGARYMELKTVQTLDELEVTKPCIDMRDEGYNCEWSQELRLQESFDEYLNAWIILHLLKDKFGWGEAASAGFIFNMSVGYNMEGILNPNVQHFLDKMENCAAEKSARVDALAKIYPRVKDLDIPDRMSDNVTISTMHGCPPDEVEKIGRYFIEERKLHTTIKLNPTLLGPARLRGILNDTLGFGVNVPDEAFGHDLKYEAGVDLIRALTRSAKKSGVAFNLKLTNTLETTNHEQDLPDNESMVYMSGRALHPISINLARRLQSEFDGALDISFSAGVDCYNIADVLACNIRPVTVCSDLLKPGGYGRLSQYLEAMTSAINDAGARDISAYISAKNGGGDIVKAGLANLERYAEAVKRDKRYSKQAFPYDNIKTSRELTPLDCIKAPCVTTCPASQDVPGYMYHAARGEYAQALEVILATNPFPNVQGMVCDHLCQYKCTRMNYDAPLLIREIKRFVARSQERAPRVKPVPNGIRVAIIGAGPSGLSCAYFLARSGFEVDVYESKAMAGGMAADAIPVFRLDDDSLKKDIDAIVDMGVQVHYGETISPEKFTALCRSHHYVYIAVGAQKGMRLGIPGEDAPGVYDQLDFLSAVRQGQAPDLGKNVIVVGGGNSAMDAARTAKRLVGKEGAVRVIYRRTRKEMPAEHEEVQAAVEEGVEIVELTAPECLLVEGGRVTSNVCFQMELGEPDASGRPRPIKIEGSEFNLQADSVISAIGQRVVLDFFPEKELRINSQTFETSLENVFAGGDAVRGAATLIKAIADGKNAAESIGRKAAQEHPMAVQTDQRQVDLAQLQIEQARRGYGAVMPEIDLSQRLGFDLVVDTLDEAVARREAARCLQCDTICNVCTTVCPNRANIAFTMTPMTYTLYRAVREGEKTVVQAKDRVQVKQQHQIFNLGDFCNECGNCATFCPTSGAPYKIKPKFYLDAQAFENEADGYMLDNGVLMAKVGGANHRLFAENGELIYHCDQVEARLNPQTLEVEAVRITDTAVDVVELDYAAHMALLLNHLRSNPIFEKISG